MFSISNASDNASGFALLASYGTRIAFRLIKALSCAQNVSFLKRRAEVTLKKIVRLNKNFAGKTTVSFVFVLVKNANL